MILRHCRDAGDARSCDDTFEAIDERSGKTLGSCYILYKENKLLFPNRPIRVFMDLHGDPLPDALLGAASARAKEIARDFNIPARVFTTVDPENGELLTALENIGFKDNDGIVLLKRDLTDMQDEEIQFPAGCILVEDDLGDETEQRYFLERYNLFYGEENDEDWLQVFISHQGFRRYHLFSRNGMCGELAAWKEGDRGVIGWFNVNQKWRGLGIATSLIRHACISFKNEGLLCAECETQARIPGVLHLLDKFDFKQTQLIMRYPGTDIDSKPAVTPTTTRKEA